MKLICFMAVVCLGFGIHKQSFQFSVLALDNTFSRALQISSVAWVDDSLYLPTEKCGKIYIGKIVGDSLHYRVARMTKAAVEGLSYCNGFFYTSDDAAKIVRRYNKTFDQPPVEYVIDLNGFLYEPKEGNGFEGIALVNDSTFFLLLEKVKNENVAVLYKGILRAGRIVITEQRLLGVVVKGRYCDLNYRNDTLFLLKSAFYGEKGQTFIKNNHNPNNDYSIEYLKVSLGSNDWLTDRPSLYVSLKRPVLEKHASFNTNVEGITSDKYGTFYAVTDNLYDNKLCDAEGENKTLLLKISHQ